MTRSRSKTVFWCASAISVTLLGLAGRSPAFAACTGDCNRDGQVTVDEVVKGVNIALGNVELSQCGVFDSGGDGAVTVEELVQAIQRALDGCPATSTPTATVADPTQTPTATLPAATQTATSAASPVPPSATATETPLPPTATATPMTPLVTSTPTATATATAPAQTICGNGLLERGETCDACAADCQVQSCTASGRHVFEVSYSGSRAATSLSVILGYRSSVLSLPGQANQSSVGARVTERPSGTFIVNDLNYALRTVIGGSSPKPTGKLFVVDFDGCLGAGQPSGDDLACALDGCSDGFGQISDCTCTAVLR